MHGTIQLTSLTGKGSTFSFTIKNIKIPPHHIIDNYPVFKTHSVVFKQSTILIVDDIKFNRDMLIGMLENFDFKFLEAENGEECVSIVQNNRIDLILLDMKMPVMNGYEVTDFLKNSKDFNSIPIIAVTASVMKQQEIQVKKITDDYLTKPVSKQKLIESIMKFIEYKESESSAQSLESEKDSSSYNLEAIRQNETLFKLLAKKEKTIIDILDKMSINQILEFSDELKELGNNYKSTDLSHFSITLKQHAENFDIENIKMMIKELIKTITI